MLHKMNRAYPLSGNNVEIITDFQTMSDRLIADIGSARQPVTFSGEHLRKFRECFFLSREL